MEVIIRGKAKEIAALVVAVQERRENLTAEIDWEAVVKLAIDSCGPLCTENRQQGV